MEAQLSSPEIHGFAANGMVTLIFKNDVLKQLYGFTMSF